MERQVELAGQGLWVETGAYPTRYRTPGGRRVFVHTVRDITARKKSEAEFNRQHRVQSVLYELLRVVQEDDDLEVVLARFLERLFAVSWSWLSDKGAIMLASDDGRYFRLVAQRNLDSFITDECLQVPAERCTCSSTPNTDILFARCDARDSTVGALPGHGHFRVPIRVADRLIGVLNLYTDPDHEPESWEETFLVSVADLLAGFLQRRRARQRRAEAMAQVRQTLEGTVAAIIQTMEVRDPYTAGHQQRVARLAVLLGEHLGWSAHQLEGLHLAAVLHDLGKLQVPAEILSKPGKLSAAEFAMIRTHPETGHSILRNIEFPWPIADIVHQHHEKLDGSAHPLGLAAALDILRNGRARLFDPTIVDACLALHDSGALAFLES